MLVQSNRPPNRDKREAAIRASSHAQPSHSSAISMSIRTSNLVLGVLGVRVAGVVLELVG